MWRTGLAKTDFSFSNTFGTRIPLVLEYLCPNTFGFEYLWVVYRVEGTHVMCRYNPDMMCVTEYGSRCSTQHQLPWQPTESLAAHKLYLVDGDCSSGRPMASIMMVTI